MKVIRQTRSIEYEKVQGSVNKLNEEIRTNTEETKLHKKRVKRTVDS